MPDSIFLVGADGSLTEAAGAPFAAEADLQKVLAAYPDLLPGAQINPDSPRRWLLVKREAGVPEHDGGGGWWAIDHLVVDQDAVPTFVEVKRASDTRSRREVVAQMLDYAANGSVFWTPGQLRGWFEDGDGAAERLAAFLEPSEEEPATSAEAFWRAVGANLRDGHIRLIFVADEIPATLRRLVEFLNEQMPRVEVLAVEIRQYRTGGGRSGALVPRLIGQTSRAQAAKEQPAVPPRRPIPWTAAEVLESISQSGVDPAPAQAVIGWATAHPHIQVTGGSGVSYPSVTMSADSGRARSRFRGVLSLYGSPDGEHPMLEIRVKQMCRTPPYNRAETRARLIADLQALGIPRLDTEPDLAAKRPNIPLDELGGGRIERLLARADQWIDDIRMHAAEPEPTDETQNWAQHRHPVSTRTVSGWSPSDGGDHRAHASGSISLASSARYPQIRRADSMQIRQCGIYKRCERCVILSNQHAAFRSSQGRGSRLRIDEQNAHLWVCDLLKTICSMLPAGYL